MAKKKDKGLKEVKFVKYGYTPKFDYYSKTKHFVTITLEVDDPKQVIEWAQENYAKYGDLTFEPKQMSLGDDDYC